MRAYSNKSMGATTTTSSLLQIPNHPPLPSVHLHCQVPTTVLLSSPMVTALLSELASQLTAWDVAMAAAVLFLASATMQKIAGKGPILWPVLGIHPSIFLNIGNIYDWATAELNRYGGTFPYRGVWFGGAHGFVTSDPANVEHMLKTRCTNFLKGRYFRERFTDLLGDGIFNVDDTAWKEQRRVATSEMHSPRFVEYSAATVRDLVHGRLLRFLSTLSITGTPIDLQDVLLRFTFDNICTIAFGIDTGCLAPDHLPVVPFLKAFEQAAELTFFRFVAPPFIWKSMRALNVGSEKHLNVAIKVVHEFVERAMIARREELEITGNLKARSDLLSRLIEAREVEDEGGVDVNARFKFSNRFIKDFCISFIFAGRETSSVALAWFFWLLHRHPAVEATILDELHSILHRRPRKTIDLDDTVFTTDELKSMEYLHATLSEALRLYPSVPFNLKEAVEDDVFPSGTMVRKGERVVISIYSMARSEQIWGKDCSEFRPERWMDKEGRLVSENQFKYAVFNAGPRLCVGKNFAYTQMKMLAAAVLLRFKVCVVEGQDIGPKMATALYIKNGLMVKFTPRERK